MKTIPLALVALLSATSAWAIERPAACPAQPMRIVRSAGGTIDYLGAVPGIPELCRISRTPGEAGDFYLGLWRADWPGAGQAYPAMRQALHGPAGTRTSFITRSVPGQQFIDSFVNQGIEIIDLDGVSYRTLRLAHEREGIEGNTYHSVITSWRDIATGANLRTEENQIAGQSYGPDTTWRAVRVETMP